MRTLNPQSDLTKLENHLNQLEACRLAPEEDTPILQQFPGLRQAVCAKINAKGCQIGFLGNITVLIFTKKCHIF